MQTGLIDHAFPPPAHETARVGGRFSPWAIVLSAALHGLAAALLLMFPPFAGPPPQEEAVPVEVWTTDQLAAVTPPAARPVETTPPPVSPQAPPLPLPSLAPPPVAAIPPAQPTPTPRTHETLRPTMMLSAAVLAQPRSRASVAFLRSLNDDGRIEQLCNIEAMAQINDRFPTIKPDSIIAYAMADTQIRRDTIVAKGAAMHGREGWTNLSFTCRTSPDRKTVLAFEYQVGDPIPRTEWAPRNLPARPTPMH